MMTSEEEPQSIDFLLEAKFQLVENFVRFGPPIPNFSAFDRLRLQALLKQSREGPLNEQLIPKPPQTDPAGRLLWYVHLSSRADVFRPGMHGVLSDHYHNLTLCSALCP